MSKRKPFKIGDLVKITMLGSQYVNKVALVVDRIMYSRHDHLASTFSDKDYHIKSLNDDFHLHPDEYSCRLKLIDPIEGDQDQIMMRAKWIESLSSVEDTKA